MSPPVAVIPSRFGAQRFPGKPLAQLEGKPLVQHVYERCIEAACFAQVLIATDDERIEAAARGFGAQVVMTSPHCPSGTDRAAEVATSLSLEAHQVVVNVQGDEPAVSPESLRALVGLFSSPEVELGTLVRPLDDDERSNANVVKVVLDEAHRALYFSRADIPHTRDVSVPVERWAHVGLYGYRAEVLRRLAGWAPVALEKVESLEQLRALHHGLRFHCAVTMAKSVSVDVPADVPRAEAALRALRGG